MRLSNQRFTNSIIVTAFVGLIFGVLLGLGASSSAAPTAGNQSTTTSNRFPGTVPVVAQESFAQQAAHQAARRIETTNDATDTPVANLYITYSLDRGTGEYTTYCSMVDPTSEFGWSYCPPNLNVGTIAPKGSDAVFWLKAEGQTLVDTFVYYTNRRQNHFVTITNWKGMPIEVKVKDRWGHAPRPIRYQLTLASVAVYDPTLPPAPYAVSNN